MCDSCASCDRDGRKRTNVVGVQMPHNHWMQLKTFCGHQDIRALTNYSQARTPALIGRILIRLGSVVSLVGFLFVCAPTASAQDQSPRARLEALGLDTARVGRVTAHFASTDRDRAVELALLADDAATFFERELDIAFPFGVAALGPEQWFSDIPVIPYAIPWPSMPDRLIFMPSSLSEGLLIRGEDTLEDRRRVDFVLLHEYGHLLAKAHLRPRSDRDYLPVSWFEELLANYFAYAYLHEAHGEWTEAARAAWVEELRRFTPPVLSLDWSFMNDLPPPVLSETYGWYQFLLNLRAAELYDEHGLDFLSLLKERLSWEEAGDWRSESLLSNLEAIAPGFDAWVADLEGGDYLRRYKE